MNLTFKKPQLFPLMAFLLFMAIFLRLGLWQIHRAQEKEGILARRAQAAHREPLPLAQLTPIKKTHQFQRVIISGHFDPPHSFLLDNQFHQGHVGYRVLTPFVLAPSKKVILVNRGWVPRGPSRAHLPEVTPEKTQVTLKGTVDFPKEKAFVLKEGAEKHQGWPKRVEIIRISTLEKHLPYSLEPFMVILLPHQKFGFAADAPPLPMPPARHYGYAIQWFALAATLFIIFIALTIKRKSSGSSPGNPRSAPNP